MSDADEPPQLLFGKGFISPFLKISFSGVVFFQYFNFCLYFSERESMHMSGKGGEEGERET